MWRAFWLAVVPVGAVLVALSVASVALGRTGASLLAPALIAVWLAYPLWSLVALWRCARRSRPWIRRLARVTVGGSPLVVLAAVGVAFLVSMQGYTIRGGVLGAFQLATPARVALENACREGRMVAGMTHEALGLAAPESYAGKHAKSVTATVAGPRAAAVAVAMRAMVPLLGPPVEDGQTVLFEGVCESGELRWRRAGGTVPRVYMPKGL